MYRFNFLHLLTALIILCIFSIMNPAYADVTGTYICSGHDPFLSEDYEFDVTINKTGDTYKVNWNRVNDLYEGYGIYENNTFSALFTNLGISRRYGIILYEVQKNNTMVGKWTYQSQKILGTETCKKISDQLETPEKIKKLKTPLSSPGLK